MPIHQFTILNIPIPLYYTHTFTYIHIHLYITMVKSLKHRSLKCQSKVSLMNVNGSTKLIYYRLDGSTNPKFKLSRFFLNFHTIYSTQLQRYIDFICQVHNIKRDRFKTILFLRNLRMGPIS
jgi:hypothetical protein